MLKKAFNKNKQKNQYFTLSTTPEFSPFIPRTVFNLTIAAQLRFWSFGCMRQQRNFSYFLLCTQRLHTTNEEEKGVAIFSLFLSHSSWRGAVLAGSSWLFFSFSCLELSIKRKKRAFWRIFFGSLFSVKIYFVNAVYLSLIELVAERSVVFGGLEKLKSWQKIDNSENFDKIQIEVKWKKKKLKHWISLKKSLKIFKVSQTFVFKIDTKICINFALRR